MPRYRSAITGRYVSELYGKRNPKTTVREDDPRRSSGEEGAPDVGEEEGRQDQALDAKEPEEEERLG